MDYAVQSRIHYAVRFRELREHTIVQIWENFREQLNDANCTDEERASIDEWFKYYKTTLVNAKFTGGDIRSSVTWISYGNARKPYGSSGINHFLSLRLGQDELKNCEPEHCH